VRVAPIPINYFHIGLRCLKSLYVNCVLLKISRDSKSSRIATTKLPSACFFLHLCFQRLYGLSRIPSRIPLRIFALSPISVRNFLGSLNQCMGANSKLLSRIFIVSSYPNLIRFIAFRVEKFNVPLNNPPSGFEGII